MHSPPPACHRAHEVPFSLDAAIPIYMPAPLTFTIAGIPFTLQWHPPISGVSASAAYQPFLSTGRGDIRLELSTGEPQRGEEVPVFDSAPIWSLYRMRDGVSFHLFDSYPELKRTLFIPDEGGRARLSFHAADHNPFVGPRSNC